MLQTALSDKDPSTMAVSVEVLANLPAKFVHAASDLHKPLLFILNQLLNGQAPKSE